MVRLKTIKIKYCSDNKTGTNKEIFRENQNVVFIHITSIITKATSLVISIIKRIVDFIGVIFALKMKRKKKLHFLWK